MEHPTAVLGFNTMRTEHTEQRINIILFALQASLRLSPSTLDFQQEKGVGGMWRKPFSNQREQEKSCGNCDDSAVDQHTGNSWHDLKKHEHELQAFFAKPSSNSYQHLAGAMR